MILTFKDCEPITQLIWLQYCVDNNSTCEDAQNEFNYINDGFVDTITLQYTDGTEILELGIWKEYEKPKIYKIPRHIHWEQFENMFFRYGCEVVREDKEVFVFGKMSTEDYDEFIINKLLEAGYIREINND